MSALDDGGPAFPAMHFDLADNEHGMTLRDYFAAKASSAMLGGYRTAGEPADAASRPVFAEIATDAYLIADAMLAARSA